MYIIMYCASVCWGAVLTRGIRLTGSLKSASDTNIYRRWIFVSYIALYVSIGHSPFHTPIM